MLTIRKQIEPRIVAGGTVTQLTVQVTEMIADTKAELICQLTGQEAGQITQNFTMQGEDYSTWTSNDMTPFNWAAARLATMLGVTITVVEA